MPLAPNGWGSSTTKLRRKIFPVQTNNGGYKIGDLIEMQLAFEEFASGIVVDVDMQRMRFGGRPGDLDLPPIKIHWFSGSDWHRSQLAVGTVAGMQVTWQCPDEIRLVSRGHKNQ
jgi:hypothetical protein